MKSYTTTVCEDDAGILYLLVCDDDDDDKLVYCSSFYDEHVDKSCPAPYRCLQEYIAIKEQDVDPIKEGWENMDRDKLDDIYNNLEANEIANSNWTDDHYDDDHYDSCGASGKMFLDELKDLLEGDEF